MLGWKSLVTGRPALWPGSSRDCVAGGLFHPKFEVTPQGEGTGLHCQVAGNPIRDLHLLFL